MSPQRSPHLAQLYGRIGGLRSRARHNPLEYTSAARRAFLESFVREVDPDLILAPEERRARAEAARKAYMAELAYRSALARAKKRSRKSARIQAPHAGEPEAADAAAASASVTAGGLNKMTRAESTQAPRSA